MRDESFTDLLLASVPHLRAFAMSLTNDSPSADDLVQETLLRAWASQSQFTSGTSVRAWTFTILRNAFHSHYRKRRREIEDVDGAYAMRVPTPPTQEVVVTFQEVRAALAQLPPEQREALILVSAEGLPYHEAARICGIPIGTIKSRVFRARSILSQELGYPAVQEFGLDRVTQAALQ
jgi:RNA polymerase sigma-70 factor (ECF subfamily)